MNNTEFKKFVEDWIEKKNQNKEEEEKWKKRDSVKTDDYILLNNGWINKKSAWENTIAYTLVNNDGKKRNGTSIRVSLDYRKDLKSSLNRMQILKNLQEKLKNVFSEKYEIGNSKGTKSPAQSGIYLIFGQPKEGKSWDESTLRAALEKMQSFSEKDVETYHEIVEQCEKEINGDEEMSEKKINKDEITTLLRNNHNIILHGAPGTGKTYLAKEIAKKMILGDSFDTEKDLTTEEQTQFNEQCGFVQFHQSYDYTDFVEGLRPVNQTGNQIGFKRKDGVFKTFCEKPLKFIDEQVKQGLEKLKEDLRKQSDKAMKIPGISNNEITITLEKEQIKVKTISEELCDINPGVISYYIKTGNDDRGRKSYDPPVGKYILEKYIPSAKKPYIFIIDEINRGEMSKIFGELFFSVDPGYRGKKGKIKTQYANLQEKPNEFDSALGIKQNVVKENGKDVDKNIDNYGHFFVPENVYIIGTMNDIDRSVESMDFAMRRRFAFKEIKAEDSQTMFDKPDSWKNGRGELVQIPGELLNKNADKGNKKNIVNRMNNLNNAILYKDFNLNSSYQIGGAYFLKFANYYDSGKNVDSAFDSLWKNHLEGVLREYLRGMDKDGKLLEKLKSAYNLDLLYEKNEKGEMVEKKKIAPAPENPS